MKSIETISLDRIDQEDGVIARDILSPSSVLLLPAGLDLSTLRSSRPDMVDLLRKHGITEIPVKKHEPITPSEFRTLLHNIGPPGATIDPLLAQVTVYQMDAVYNGIEEKIQGKGESIRSFPWRRTFPEKYEKDPRSPSLLPRNIRSGRRRHFMD